MVEKEKAAGARLAAPVPAARERALGCGTRQEKTHPVAAGSRRPRRARACGPSRRTTSAATGAAPAFVAEAPGRRQCLGQGSQQWHRRSPVAAAAFGSAATVVGGSRDKMSVRPPRGDMRPGPSTPRRPRRARRQCRLRRHVRPRASHALGCTRSRRFPSREMSGDRPHSDYGGRAMGDGAASKSVQGKFILILRPSKYLGPVKS